jgi:hypothetical protein
MARRTRRVRNASNEQEASSNKKELVCILKNTSRHEMGAYVSEQRFFSKHMVVATLTIGFSLEVKIYNTPAEVRLLITFRQASIICRIALKRVPVERSDVFEVIS